MQTISEGPLILGICQSSSKRVRIHDGANSLYPSGYSSLVPICLGVPDQVAVQVSEVISLVLDLTRTESRSVGFEPTTSGFGDPLPTIR